MSKKGRKANGQFKKQASGGSGGSGTKTKSSKSKWKKTAGGTLARVGGASGIRAFVSVPFLTMIGGITSGFVVGGLLVDSVCNWWKKRSIAKGTLKPEQMSWLDSPLVRSLLKAGAGIGIGVLGGILKVSRYTMPVATGIVVNAGVTAARVAISTFTSGKITLAGTNPALSGTTQSPKQVANHSNGTANGSTQRHAITV